MTDKVEFQTSKGKLIYSTKTGWEKWAWDFIWWGRGSPTGEEVEQQ